VTGKKQKLRWHSVTTAGDAVRKWSKGRWFDSRPGRYQVT